MLKKAFHFIRSKDENEADGQIQSEVCNIKRDFYLDVYIILKDI